MEKVLILISGMPGIGKTRFGEYLSENIGATLICKDKVKEIIWDKVQYDTNIRTESKIYAGLAYDLSFHFCEMLMRANQTFIFESNFVHPAGDNIHQMVKKYGYKVINVLFDGDVEVIHKRFVERDVTSERHPGLASNGFFNDLKVFRNAAQACSNFKYGDVLITVDATDFSKVSYENLVDEIVNAK